MAFGDGYNLRFYLKLLPDSLVILNKLRTCLCCLCCFVRLVGVWELGSGTGGKPAAFARVCIIHNTTTPHIVRHINLQMLTIPNEHRVNSRNRLCIMGLSSGLTPARVYPCCGLRLNLLTGVSPVCHTYDHNNNGGIESIGCFLGRKCNNACIG